jgi:hypothetical protein
MWACVYTSDYSYGYARAESDLTGVIAVSAVLQICNSSGANCSNVSGTYATTQNWNIHPGFQNYMSGVGLYSPGHTYKGCVFYVFRSGINGGGCSNAITW